MSLWKWLLLVLAALLVSAAVALHTGFARWAFFEVFALVKGDDLLTPTVVRDPPTDSPYDRWLELARDDIPLFEGLVIDDVSQVPLRPWPQMGTGVTGLYLRFADYQVTDGRLLGLPPGGRTAAQRHLYEKAIYVVGGSGYTEIQQEDKPADRIEWSAGDLFSIPLNVHHRHHASADAPARLLAVTTFPLLLNVIDDIDFVTANPYVFLGRYDGSPGYFADAGARDELVARANFVADVPRTRTHAFEHRGAGNRTAGWQMAGNSMLGMHVSEMAPRRYKKAHRHTSDAFILLLAGEGFSLTWPEGGYDRRERVDWRAGTLFVPPTYWYHQHLNTGREPARYLAINSPPVIRNIGLRFIDQIEVDLEDIKDEWRRELERRDASQP